MTKFVHFFAIPSKFSVAQVAELFFWDVFILHGLPKTIFSNRDNKFMGGFWQERFWLVGTNLTPSTSYHPQTDGQMKIVNKWIEGYLRNYVLGQQRAWIKWLHLGEYFYNTTYYMSIRMSPFRALYGYDTITFVDFIFGDRRSPKAKEWIQESRDILKALKDNL